MDITTSAVGTRALRRRPSRSRWFAPPWRDPAGRFSWLKIVALGLCIAPAVYIGVLWTAGGLGARPITQSMLDTGEWGIRFLLVSLAITPARTLFDWPRVVQLRRMTGLAAAAYTIAHLIFYAAQQNFAWGFVLHEMFFVFYLLLGTIATIGFVLLAVTSSDAAMFRLGRNWKRLHWLVYPIAILSFWHFFLTQKVEITIAAVPAGLLIWLLLWRAEPAPLRRSWTGLIGLSIIIIAITALGEAGWYALNSGINPRLVLAANLSLVRPSPAVLVAVDLVVLIVLVGLRRLSHAKRGLPAKSIWL
jgi:sulfoxide reductase heme-binding subunit YedZ